MPVPAANPLRPLRPFTWASGVEAVSIRYKVSPSVIVSDVSVVSVRPARIAATANTSSSAISRGRLSADFVFLGFALGVSFNVFDDPGRDIAAGYFLWCHYTS